MTMLLERIGTVADTVTDKVIIRRPPLTPVACLARGAQCDYGYQCCSHGCSENVCE